MFLFQTQSEALPHDLFAEEDPCEWPAFKQEDLATLPSPQHKCVEEVQSEPEPEPRRGRWSQLENRLYLRFLLEHRFHFEMSQLRRIDKIFKVMSRYIGSRSAQQCRSHHQKMEKKYLRFEDILDNLSRQYSGPLFQ